MKQQSQTTKDSCQKKKNIDMPDLDLLSLRASVVDIDIDVALPQVSGDQRA